MIKEWVSRFNWWPRPELSGRGNNLIPPPLSHQQEPPTMTTSREELIARLRYYACEDAAQGDVLNDVIALLQRDGETIERMHTAICQAVALLNAGNTWGTYPILRQALIDYADAALKENNDGNA